MTVCNNAMMLLLDEHLDGVNNQSESDCVTDHFNYIFGTNPMSTCYVTGFGTLSPMNTHHRPSMAVRKSMPGMLVGGPDNSLEDPYAKSVLAKAPAAKCYADNSQSYSCNEVTIYWNASLIYMMADVLSEK